MNMLRASRATGGLAVCAVLLSVVAVPTAEAAAVSIPSPATVLSVSPTNTNLNFELQGAVCQSPNTCTPVLYVPFYDPSGVTALQNALTTTSASKIIVFGYSDGAQVAEQWLKQHLNDPNAPSPKVLSFVVIGNATRAFGGDGATLGGEVWPQSAYKVIDIARQYDAAADYPNNPASPYYLMAVTNANLGFWFGLHDYSNVNIYDPANAVWTSADGNITYVLAPTPYVPILGLFAPLFPSLNAQMKAQIETAYIRPVPFPTTTQPASPATSPAAASVLSTSVVSDPTVASEPTTVPVSLAPAATAATPAPAPPATEPTKTNRLDTVAAAAATTATPTHSDAGNVAPTVQTITAPAVKPPLNTASAAKLSTTAATGPTPTSSTNGNNGATDNANDKTAATGKANGKTEATGKADGKTAATGKANGNSGGHR